MIKRIFTTLCFVFLQVFLFAQEKANEVEMADAMRRNGRIYVVVAVVLAIFAGIIIYLIRLDKKITRLEKSQFINPK